MEIKCTTPKMNALCRLACTRTNFVRCVYCLTTNALCRTAEIGALLPKCVLIVYIWPEKGVQVLSSIHPLVGRKPYYLPESPAVADPPRELADLV